MANQNVAGNEIAIGVDETQVAANNANDGIQTADDGDVEMPAEPSTDVVALDVVEIVPLQEAVVQST